MTSPFIILKTPALSGLSRKNGAQNGQRSAFLPGFPETASEGDEYRCEYDAEPAEDQATWGNFSNLRGTLLWLFGFPTRRVASVQYPHSGRTALSPFPANKPLTSGPEEKASTAPVQ